jgi:hypothetical protein
MKFYKSQGLKTLKKNRRTRMKLKPSKAKKISSVKWNWKKEPQLSRPSPIISPIVLAIIRREHKTLIT